MNSLRTLIVSALACSTVSAAPIVLYETGWEAAPASPGWAPGAIAPQNGWVNFNAALGHQVVANGSAGASVNGQNVVTPYGNQMHRFEANPSTVSSSARFTWVDLQTGFDSRPAGYNFLTGSIDLFVPGVQSADASLYGLVGFDGAVDDFGILVDPSTREILLVGGGLIRASSIDAFSYDTWLNLSVSANYETGEVIGYVNGAPVPGLSFLSPTLVGGSFSDLDLYVQNALTPPTVRSIFSDNYRVTLDVVPVPEPGTLALMGVGGLLLFSVVRRMRR